MTKNPENTVTLPNGTEVAFGPPSVWDSVKFREKFDRNIEALGMEQVALDAMTPDERDDYDQFRQLATLWVVWRCAVAGGYDKDEETFWNAVPLTGGTFARIVEVATSFFGEQPASVMSPGSSGRDSAAPS